ncbi:hypothetical protein Leryth_011962 [Lithospermum erythrorhizon]|uniref:UDENN domain-containing protein n=1 Tax=Lithospermum erythrorhizon TaxID=34254 RepID=A0AAV3P7V0_LITER|nr:hypothetical protein Leryth_011962 [Lithospermum erythrorhizon]
MSRSPSFSIKSETDIIVDVESLQRWVVAFCIIRFDLEQGQLIEECYPPNSISQNEEHEVAFSSFPDSISQQHNRSSIHDCIFFFRVKRQEFFQSSNKPTSEITEIDNYEADVSVGRKELKVSTNKKKSHGSKYLYGFVFNRQRHDERLKRGGEQKSVVILSHCPFTSVFRPLLQIMGPLYFDIGNKALMYIGSCISSWPDPIPGTLVDLPICNATLKVSLPPAHSLPLDGGLLPEDASLSINQSIPQGLFHDSDVFGIFRALLMQLWRLWELLLIGEPILVIAPTPPQCSEAVASLVSLIAPLYCSVDFRPYFTIHDPEFARLNSLQEGAVFPAMILGVTNLFFLKSLRVVPHVVSVGCAAPSSSRIALTSRASTGRISSLNEAFGIQNLSLRKFSPSNLFNAVKLKREGPLSLMTEHREEIWSNYAAVTKPDTSILNRLVDAGISPRVEESMSVVNNEILRRHFLELTTNFLAPFGSYFRATAPSEGSSPFVDPPPLPSFNADEFLSNLLARGPGKFLLKRMRSNWLDLYRRFLKGPNFLPWYRRKRAIVEQEQYSLWRQARIHADIGQLISKMSEVESVDSFNAIEKHLLVEMQHRSVSADSEAACEKLKNNLQVVFSILPKDKQQMLLMNPERAALLRTTHEGVELPKEPHLGGSHMT